MHIQIRMQYTNAHTRAPMPIYSIVAALLLASLYDGDPHVVRITDIEQQVHTSTTAVHVLEFFAGCAH